MKNNIDNYRLFYEKLKNDIENANNCINSNPCSKLIEYIDEIKSGITNSLANLEWQDDAKNKYDLALETGINNLDKISESINTNWKNAETLYQTINSELDKFNSAIGKLETNVGNEPKRYSNKYKVNDIFNESLYRSDYNNWKSSCDTVNNECSSLQKNINDLIQELQKINGNSIEINKISSLPKGKNTVVNAKGYRIVIDAGHGGTDAGASYFGIKESDMNLQYSLALAEELTSRGLDVTLTRTGDETLSKEERKRRMNQAYSGDNVIIISNHMNATGKGNAQGMEIYVPIDESRNGTPLAEKILQRVEDETSIIQHGSGVKTKRSTENKNRDYFFMISGTGKKTTILLEHGFIDNKEDLEKLVNNKDENIMAVANGICDYIDS